MLETKKIQINASNLAKFYSDLLYSERIPQCTMKYLFFFISTLYINSVYCQLSFQEIDFTRIPQRKIRHYLERQINNDIGYFSDLQPSSSNNRNSEELFTMQNSYLIKESPEIVWDTYNTADLAKAWNGKIISLGFLCSKWSDYVVYKNSTNYCSIDTGQVFFLNLRILYGMYNLPVGIQVININADAMSVTFSYLDGGKSVGTQTIQLIATDQGYTKVIHRSAFKSGSHFRDKHLYPYYHTKVLNEFHRNIANNITTEKDFFLVLPQPVDPD